MSLVSKRSMGFTSIGLQKRKEPHALHYLSERLTFWIAVISLFAFVTGNMVGQNGWHVFWKSVMGEQDDSLIVFNGTVLPIKEIPDPTKWAAYGGDFGKHTFSEAPRDTLVALPHYAPFDARGSNDVLANRIYSVENCGTYATGTGKGSHAGMDIIAPEGTPVLAIANGVVAKVKEQAGGYGKYVTLRIPNAPDPSNPSKLTTLFAVYAHLSQQSVAEGDVLRKGEMIGLVGHTGMATTSHLHFQLQRDLDYWPFTTAQQNAAGLSFTQAIDRGLNHDDCVARTLNGMQFVQNNLSYTPSATVATASSSSSVKPVALTLKERIAQRATQRKEALAARSVTLAVQSAPVPTVVSTQTVAVQTDPDPVPAGPADVASVLIKHDGSFGRNIEDVTVTILDAAGKKIENPEFTKPLYLRTGYGRAEFDPPVLTAQQFKKGIATVRVRPIGETTIIIEVQPLGITSKPMKYER